MTMTQKQAVKLVQRLAFAIAKIRSNMVEAIRYGKQFDELPPGEQGALRTMYPVLFPEEGKISLIEFLTRLQSKAEAIEPMDLYNLISLIERDEALPTLLKLFLNSGGHLDELPQVHPVPKWISHWDEE